MKIIIDIPDNLYDAIEKDEYGVHQGRIYDSIRNGTPFPKRMLSVDLIIETLCPKDEDYDNPCISPRYLKEELERLLLDDAPNSIEKR